MTERHARHLCQRLLQHLDWKRRPDLLDDWTKDDLGHLAPLFARVAGPQGVAAVAREIVDVVASLSACGAPLPGLWVLPLRPRGRVLGPRVVVLQGRSSWPGRRTGGRRSGGSSG
ncbi:hypothetical protein [Sorangium sp. So ce362]|uniref:hypothetical protein n=1 Tax=Sorangium sp. So ce362 TaxID=3133303 RepID=UPI003F627E76